MYTSEFVKIEIKDNIAVVTLDRPPVNAVCEEVRIAIAEFFESLNHRTDVFCVILRAEGPGFSGGHDLKEGRLHPERRARNQETISRSSRAVYECRVPVIAAVHGYVIGMGFAYASVCDMIVASEDASFKFPEITVGTVGGPFWFKRIVPDKVARECFYTAQPLSAQQMYDFGAVNKVVPKDQLLDAAMEIAKEICANYPPSIWASKMVIVEGEKEVQDVVDISDRMRDRGNKEILGGDPNRTELARARLEKRKPVFDLSFFEKRLGG